MEKRISSRNYCLRSVDEVYSRQPVLREINIWFLSDLEYCVWFSSHKALLLAARFLAGVGASINICICRGMLDDISPPEQRGPSMGLYILTPSLDATIGPVIRGFITQGTTWRWISWSTSIVQGLVRVVSFFAFQKTYADYSPKESTPMAV